MLDSRGFTRTRRFDDSTPSEIRRIYDNSDMIRFMTTRQADKRNKVFSVSHRKNISVLPEISNPSTRDEQRHPHPRNNSLSLKQEHYNKDTTFLVDFRSTIYHKPTQQTFVWKSNDMMVMKALLKNGWREVKPRNSTHFTLKWVEEQNNMDFIYLKDTQSFNHLKNIEQVIRVEHLAKVLDKSGFWCRTYNVDRDYDEFSKEFDQCAIMNLLKKHIQYFKIKAKQIVDHPISVNIVDMLKTSKFTQFKNNSFLVNVALLVQACLYFQQLLQNIGLPFDHGLDINLDSRSIQNMVTYSRLNPPYDQYQSFKHSYMANDSDERNSTTRTSSKDVRNRVNFSRNFQRYNSEEPLATPSVELISLLVKYHRTFSKELNSYKGDGTENQWLLLTNQHRNWREQVVSNKKLNITSNLLVQKLIEKPLTLNSNRTLVVKTFALLVCKEGGYSIYMLNKHFAFEIFNIGECPLIKSGQQNSQQLMELQKVSEMLNLKSLHFMELFDNQIRNIVSKSITLKDLEKRKNCFSLVTFFSVIDTHFNVWLQDIKAEADLFTKGAIDEDLSIEIASQMIRIIMNIQENGKYWECMTPKAQIVTNSTNTKLSMKALNNGVVRLIKDRLIAEKCIQELAKRLVLQQFIGELKVIAREKTQRKKESIIDIRLGASLLSRIERSRIKHAFNKIYSLYLA